MAGRHGPSLAGAGAADEPNPDGGRPGAGKERIFFAGRGRLTAMRSVALRWVLGAGLAGLAGTPAAATPGEVLTTVYSTAYNGYTRAKQSDGTFKPETYMIGEGKFEGGRMRDPSIDGFPFLKLARLLAPYLARANYLPTPGRDQTDLMIVVHWGTTIPYDDGTYRDAVDGLSTAVSNSQNLGSAADSGELTGALMMIQMENRQRDLADARNAALLGYAPEMNRLGDMRWFSGIRTRYDDLVSDVEEDRYYVILAAYDFHEAWKARKKKLLWITRVSISVRGNRFDEQLEGMLASAAQYFGRDTPGLMRGYAPEGKVKIGEPKVIGVVPEPKK